MSSERYRLLEPLGHGGQGRTYRALDSATGIQVAVKQIRLRHAEWKHFDLFERECRVLKSLSHPGIPRYIDSYAEESEGRYSLVMELIEGRTAKHLLTEGQRFTGDKLRRLLEHTLDILAYLHGLHPPVIHRDIKPANLMLRADGSPALVDFGGVRVALAPEGGSTVVGSYGYIAPEQLHGEATTASDVYGLGATLAALAAGREADKLPRRGLAIDLDTVMAAGPLRELLAAMVRPDPQGRLGSVDEVRRALKALDRGLEIHAALPIEVNETSPRVGEETGQDLPDIVEQPFSAILHVVGHVGLAALVLVESIVLPLVHALLSTVWAGRPDRLRRLQRSSRTIRKGLRQGRGRMKDLSAGRPPTHRQLPQKTRRRGHRHSRSGGRRRY